MKKPPVPTYQNAFVRQRKHKTSKCVFITIYQRCWQENMEHHTQSNPNLDGHINQCTEHRKSYIFPKNMESWSTYEMRNAKVVWNDGCFYIYRCNIWHPTVQISQEVYMLGILKLKLMDTERYTGKVQI